MAITDTLHTKPGVQSACVGNQHLYRRHRPEETSLYPLIEANPGAFLEHLIERDTRLPRFVTNELKEYLRCGRLEQAGITCWRASRDVWLSISARCRPSRWNCCNA